MNGTYQHIADFAADPSFQRYALEQSPLDVAIWENYLIANPHQVATIDEAVKLLKSVSFPALSPDPIRTATTRDQLIQRIQTQSEPKIKRLSVGRMLVAASIVMLAFVGAWWWSQSATEAEYHTDFGENMQLVLQDGSQVTLNANSTLRIPNNWGDVREVWLEGEAFFDIEPQNPTRRFVVHANPVEVEVLGTSFNVKQRGEIADVILTEGHVSLRIAADTLDMQPGDRVVIREGIPTKTSDVKVAVLTAWKEGKLAFSNTPLVEVASRMEEVFGVTVYVAPGLIDRRLTGSLGSDNLDLLILALSETFDLSIQTRNDTIWIEP